MAAEIVTLNLPFEADPAAAHYERKCDIIHTTAAVPVIGACTRSCGSTELSQIDGSSKSCVSFMRELRS
jgi:hypothetical protein